MTRHFYDDTQISASNNIFSLVLPSPEVNKECYYNKANNQDSEKSTKESW